MHKMSELPEPGFTFLNVQPICHPEPMATEEAVSLLIARMGQCFAREGVTEAFMRVKTWRSESEYLPWADGEKNPDYGKHFLMLEALIDFESYQKPVIMGERAKLFREVVEIHPPEEGLPSDPGKDE